MQLLLHSTEILNYYNTVYCDDRICRLAENTDDTICWPAITARNDIGLEKGSAGLLSSFYVHSVTKRVLHFPCLYGLKKRTQIGTHLLQRGHLSLLITSLRLILYANKPNRQFLI